MVIIIDLDGGATEDRLFLFGEHFLFDNEEDQISAMDDYESANGGEYNLSQAESDCLLDDFLPSTFLST